MKPIGIFGGTFDPIHNGHLALIRLALDTLPLERILVLPAGAPPMRPAPPAAPISHRLQMARLALRDMPRTEVSDLDAAEAQPSYTHALLERIAAAHPGTPLVLLLGADSAARMHQWRNPQRIRELAEVAVVDRPGHAGPASAIGTSAQRVSASAIRAAASAGTPLDQWLPPAVARHIAAHRLYRPAS